MEKIQSIFETKSVLITYVKGINFSEKGVDSLKILSNLKIEDGGFDFIVKKSTLENCLKDYKNDLESSEEEFDEEYNKELHKQVIFLDSILAVLNSSSTELLWVEFD